MVIYRKIFFNQNGGKRMKEYQWAVIALVLFLLTVSVSAAFIDQIPAVTLDFSAFIDQIPA